MKILINENRLYPTIKSVGILKTIIAVGGHEIFDKLAPDYFYSRNESNIMKFNTDHAIEFINECVEVNEVRENEGQIYLYEYAGDIAYEEWDGEGDDDNEYFSYESRIESVGRDMVFGSIWQIDDEGEMFDDSYDTFRVPLNELPENILKTIFHMLYGDFKL
jgi:hypothetical protein